MTLSQQEFLRCIFQLGRLHYIYGLGYDMITVWYCSINALYDGFGRLLIVVTVSLTGNNE